ncbi:MAG: DNA topoisomerase III [Blautia sp.]|nr:DNA topoisomerase III [Blautia sp.]
MAKTIVIAEKPSVARDIARVLHCQKKEKGALEGDKYVVTWALGHLVTLADPEAYDKKYEKWAMDTLPMIPEQQKLVVIPETQKQYQAVRTQLFRKDVDDVIIATDAGREGELVARWILEKSGCKKPIRRLWISSVTDKAIKDGFAHLKDGRDYDNLYRAAAARAEADWLVGMNGTRALTCKYNAQLSCGRVQTPTLAIIRKREEEIRRFTPKEFYGISLEAGGISFTWKDPRTGSGRISEKEKADQILQEVKNGVLEITSVVKKKKTVQAPGLYDLTTLQREASQRFGFSPKETLNICQRLYENHKVLTYPRTDSRYLTQDVVPTIRERLQAVNIGIYKPFVGSILKRPIHTGKSFVNDAKVTDHHAIIPTEQYVQMEHMTNEEKKIYDMVVRRFLAVLCPPAEYEEAAVEGRIGRNIFTAKGQIMIQRGWREVYTEGFTEEDEDPDEDEWQDRGKKTSSAELPSIRQGDRLKVSGAALRTGKTRPPKRFTEATLLAAMENPVGFMESKDRLSAKTLSETGGLGTVATRADIIEKLFSGFMMEKRGNEIYLTSKAKQLLELVPEDLRKPELTAYWEMKLSDISQGRLKQQAFLTDIRKYTSQIVDEIRKGQGTYRHDNLTNKPCPRCGKKMLAVNGKNSRMLVCQDRECGYRETIARSTNAHCPKCHKKMELLVKGSEETFVCVCGYKERMSAFQARREKEGGGVKKADVQKYMKEQKKEANQPLNNAFAEALAGLKLE